MKITLLTVILFLINPTLLTKDDFKASQLKYPRVKTAFQNKGSYINNILSKKNIEHPHIYIRAFKLEEKLEVWAKSEKSETYKLITEYSFCYSSGGVGPKRKQGDYQIPEGFYEINIFNPKSKFHLSLGVNYPNQSDKISSNASNLGGDIFIHGNCVTIGCIPITDNYIEELYILAVEAKNNGQLNIPIHIFPSKINDAGYKNLIQYADTVWDADYSKFWLNLKEGYDYFENTHKLPKIEISNTGKYLIN